MSPRVVGTLAFGLAGVLLVGCGGGDNVPRFHVSGTVNYDGKPVPAGTIIFSPGPGNPGPQGHAKIKDGKYDTHDGKGGPGGAVSIRVEGFDGQSTDQRPMGKAVFSYDTKADLPKADTTKDFDIKAKEAQKAADAPPA